ncbi:MAG: hypothetical protein R3C29_04560 [Dehalococcoidia bacterium]
MDNGIIGLSLVIITIGAVLAWAVDIEVTGFDINVAGVILMVMGIVGLALSLLFWERLPVSATA